MHNFYIVRLLLRYGVAVQQGWADVADRVANRDWNTRYKIKIKMTTLTRLRGHFLACFQLCAARHTSHVV